MSIKTIVMHENILGNRGTTVALYDYAHYLQEYFDIRPIVCFPLNADNNADTVRKFQKEFLTLGYEHFSHVQTVIDAEKADYFYAIKYGQKDGVVVRDTKNLIHSVFERKKSSIHGSVYAVVSKWQSMMTGFEIPYVPHMINLPDTDQDMRVELGIPKDAVVLGRHGGYDTFNIEFAVEELAMALDERKDLWMIFLNTEKRINHQRCIYLDSIVDLEAKTRFINTCDAMLHARDYGETFGLSVLEFAAKNKQIIAFDAEEYQSTFHLGGRNHFLFLRENCHRYRTRIELRYILKNIEKNNPFDTRYLNDEFGSKAVMDAFKTVFLD
jgi:hypothetical protein